MTILVTGGAGYIGSHVVYELVESGRQVIVLDNLSTARGDTIPKQARLIEGDVGDENLLHQVIGQYGVSAVLHFASSTDVSESMRDPLAYYRNNTLNSSVLINAAIRGGVKHFIFSSSAAVYGGSAQMPLDEEAVLNPLSPYGRSKWMTETMLADAGRAFGLSYAILRYFNVAGADPKLRTGPSTLATTHLIRVAVQAALGQRPSVKVFGTDYPTADGTCVRDYIHVTDVVSVHADALRYLEAGNPRVIVNCGYGRGFSVIEVIETVKRVSGVDFAVNFAPRRPGDTPEMVAASDRAKTLLGWKPRYDDLKTIVSHALAWENALRARP